MELNFLEPENAVFLSGLVAFVFVLRPLNTSAVLPLLAAGFSLAVGFQFKSVVAFYLIGIVGFFVLQQIRRRITLLELWRSLSVLLVGFVISSSIPVMIFAATGKLSEFWLWTIEFPLFHYPSNTFWVNKLFTKLLWFHALLLASILASGLIRSRRKVWNNNPAVLAFFMGLASYLALLKTQSSHYCFPGAAFFSIFIAATLAKSQKRTITGKTHVKRFAVAAVVAVLLVPCSAILYRPQATSRFLEWRNYQEEELLGSQVRRDLIPGGKALFVRNGTLLYWVSGIETATRFINFDVQTTYFVERNPNALLNAINNQSTGIIEFDPLDPGFEDKGFDDLAKRSSLLTEFTKQLEDNFRPAEVSPAPFHFWVRKTVSER
jgi:hypothetical protein